MTAISPIATSQYTAGQSAAGSSTDSTSNQFGQDTFLKLLVAQLKYQDPMNPTDGTAFIAQTAQFTTVEKLNEISQELKTNSAATEVLEAGSMVGKAVTVATKSGKPAATTVAHVGGNLSLDDAVGAKATTSTTIYTTQGTPVPIQIEMTKLADGADGSRHWAARAMLGSKQLAGPFTVDFDSHGERTSGDISITGAQLNAVPDTTGLWNTTGVRLDLGTSTDPSRLRVGAGSDGLTTFGQNGTDGTSIRGVVTGVQFTANGPLLTINDKQYPLTDVTDVHVV